MTTDPTSPRGDDEHDADLHDPLPDVHDPAAGEPSGATRESRASAAAAAGVTERVAPRAGAATGSPATPRPRGGRLLAGLALLVALAALGGAGYLYYALIEKGDVRQAADAVTDLRSRLTAQDQRFDQLAKQQQAALEQFREREETARAAAERSLRESLAAVARQAPPSTGEWQRAEAQYLLRIANHRLQMEHDVEGALHLLRAADSVLADLDDFALHEVRARIADEVAALEGVKGVDVEGLYLQLDAVKRHLDELPLRMPEYLHTEPAAAPEPPPAPGWWAALKRQLTGLLRVRHLEGAVKPLLGPDEAVYLQLNLRLMLERAQLAAVRRQQMIYEGSIATAIDWVRQYLDTDKPDVQRMLGELTSLHDVDLAQPLPDISGSLNALQEVLRHPA